MSAEVYSSQDNPLCISHLHIPRPLTSSISFSNQAVLAIQQQQYNRAKRLLDNSLACNPLNYLALFNYASLHCYLEQTELALGKMMCALSVLYMIIGK